MNTLLQWIEKIGNKLPDPAIIFIVLSLLVMLLSSLLAPSFNEDGSLLRAGWQIEFKLPSGESKQENVKSLLSSDGLYWAVSSSVQNFVEFAPLGVVLVSMLGIGVAEKSGFLAALLSSLLSLVSKRFLEPLVIFLGVMSSLGLDAGYLILPPLAASLFSLAGKSPLAGIAASFAGVSAGFSANFFLTSLDPLLAGFSSEAIQLIEPQRSVAVSANWYFMIASTILITLLGWWVTRRFVNPLCEPALSVEADNIEKPGVDRTGLIIAVASIIALSIVYLLLASLEGSFLFGKGEFFARWVHVLVPFLFLVFLVPGFIYGLRTRKIRTSHDLVEMMNQSMRDMAPIIVLAFFAAQFVAYFDYSNIGKLLAHSGADFLLSLQVPSTATLLAFILLTMIFNIFVGSMSAKYAVFAPVFIPMLALSGIDPEVTQGAYRIGDSVTNTITPLNPYLIIILAYARQYQADAGIGTMIRLMLPYTIVFGIVWTTFFLVWVACGIPLGPY